tara:strand:+ start:274 stop:378 length:105 start_codon:yes stop_codon:yes gene_type:complete
VAVAVEAIMAAVVEEEVLEKLKLLLHLVVGQLVL